MSGNSCTSALHTAPIVSAFAGVRRGLGLGYRHQPARYVSLYLPICTSSPSASLCESIR